MTFTDSFLQETATIARAIDRDAVEKMVDLLIKVRSRNGRLFSVGSGGGAGHASHAVCDFRKLAGFEAYSVSDNVSELTARINDEGWDSSYANWLKVSRLNPNDLVFVFSVGGGDLKRAISPNLVRAVEYARQTGAAVCGIVGRDGGYTALVADACVIVPVVNSEAVTPHTEAFQAVIWHLLISHPRLRTAEAKWESTR